MYICGMNNEELIQKVSDLYNKNGVKSVTMDDVARELGMSKKTLYLHFKDKDDFYFTQILFSNTDIYESLLGRSNTHDIRLLCTVLDVIHENKLKRDEWRNLQKRISALMVVSSFDFDSYKESKNKIESLIVT